MGLNPRPLHWELGVLITGTSGKPPGHPVSALRPPQAAFLPPTPPWVLVGGWWVGGTGGGPAGGKQKVGCEFHLLLPLCWGPAWSWVAVRLWPVPGSILCTDWGARGGSPACASSQTPAELGAQRGLSLQAPRRDTCSVAR